MSTNAQQPTADSGFAPGFLGKSKHRTYVHTQKPYLLCLSALQQPRRVHRLVYTATAIWPLQNMLSAYEPSHHLLLHGLATEEQVPPHAASLPSLTLAAEPINISEDYA